jgi:predicted Zn-dependent protease
MLPWNRVSADAVVVVARMAPIIYTEEGDKISAQVWQETMHELGFAHVEDILRNVSC